MRVVRYIQLDRQEREIVKRALVHIRIPFTDEELADRDGDVAKAIRSFTPLVQGEACSHAVLERAYKALRVLYVACKEQSERDYWEAELDPREGYAAGAVVENDDERVRVALVAPGTDVCGMLAETRAGQARDADAALVVVGLAAGKSR